jgi:hypothetical protein
MEGILRRMNCTQVDLRLLSFFCLGFDLDYASVAPVYGRVLYMVFMVFYGFYDIFGQEYG